MFAGEETASGELRDQRSGVAARDVDALARRAVVVVPDDGNAMRGVLAREPHEPREALRPDVFEANEADPRDGRPAMKLRPERRRQDALDDVGIDAEVHQDSPSDRAVDLRDVHAGLTIRRR